MKESEEYTASETVETAIGDKINVGYKLKAPYGVSLKAFVSKWREMVHWMRNQGQTSLDFDSTVVLEDVTIQSDKPSKNRNTGAVVIGGLKCGGTNGYTLQSALHNLAQTKTPLDIKLVIRPKSAKKATGKKSAPTQPGESKPPKTAKEKDKK